MSSYMEKKIVCMCCGKEYQKKILTGFMTTGDIDLDTNPYTPAVYDKVVMCPHCGYSTSRPFRKIDSFTKSIVNSREYTDIFQKESDETYKKLKLAAFLASENEAYKDAAFHYLSAYWYSKEKYLTDKKNVCELAIKNFEKYLTDNMDIQAAIIMIDCMRQIKKFSEALETAESLEQYVGEKSFEKQILIYEKKLINNKDFYSHKVREVMK